MSHAFNVASSSASVPQQHLGAGNNHPGDYAEPLVIKEWVKTMRAEYDKTNLAPILADEVPASIRRQTEPVPLTIYPEYTGASYTDAQKSARLAERALLEFNNAEKLKERTTSMRELRHRVYAEGGKLSTVPVDTLIGGYAHDLTRDSVTEQLVELATDPRCVGVLASFPCKTWSTARFNQPGPPLLRDIEQPLGIRDAKGYLPPEVARPNAIVTNGTRILRAAHAHGAAIVIEAPPRRERHTSVALRDAGPGPPTRNPVGQVPP